MILDHVSTPADLAALDADELDLLADELRSAIVDAVMTHGGHLGSNLGAVELTIALHRVFDSPHDALLWDTGHQCYPHKLLTGRSDGFAALRQADGMSGYPSRAESPHDWVENSHASTILAYAHGLATAEALRPTDPGRRRRIVAVIGDGSLTGGMAFEGLNNLGHAGADCIVVFNDNGRSYAPTASRLGATLRGGRPIDADEPVGVGAGTDAVHEAALADPPRFFETLGLSYHGPIDGHDRAALETALAAAAERPGPQVLHVLTSKGRGYGPAENDPVKRLHDTSEAKPGSYTSTFGDLLGDLAAADDRVVAITAAMPDSTGLLGFGERHPGRLIDVGIAEQHAVTSAAGMAMGGLVPVVALYSTFLTRAVDQAIYDVGLHGLGVVFCIDRAGITGDDGASHHGVLDLVLLSRVPGITIFAPSSLAEQRAMLRHALAIAGGPNPAPVALRWPKTMPPDADADASGRGVAVGVGTAARRLQVGEDVCLIGVGKMLAPVREAAALLEGEGLSVTVWDPRCVRPLDDAMLRDAARHRCVVTVEDGLREGGIGAAVADALAERTCAVPHPPRVRVLGTPPAFIPHGKPDAVLAALGLGAHGIAEQARTLVRTRPLDRVGALS
ncbi:MAG: 1-deoxy-D-xylulose-5-phosphate synthase [Acidimicrobiales bacterium]|nr:1-deoxy-D-xylulose-5-phosphate synthase [Acidimicrobiales bacterium]